MHQLAEDFLLNKPDWASGAMPANLYTFKPCVRVLREHVGRVFGIEFPLWSDRLRTAGRADLVCEYDGVPSILDFKTSRKEKKDEHIWGYFVQKTTYAQMFEERTGLRIEKIVTLMPVDHEPLPSIWVKDRKEFDEEVDRVFVRRTGTDPGLLLPGGRLP